MTSRRRNVYQLRLHVDGNHSQCLNYIYNQQRIISASGASDALEVRAKAGGELDLADGHDPGFAVNQSD